MAKKPAMSVQQSALPPHIDWVCPECSIRVGVYAFPVHCQCGYVDPGKESSQVNGEAKRREAICEECHHFTGLKCLKICRGPAAIKKWKRATRKGSCPEGKWKQKGTPSRSAEKAKGSEHTWIYGVTTVPARIENGLLKRTLDSLALTGFPYPRIFIDGECDIPEWLASYPLTIRVPTIRTPAHWTLSMWELYLREPHKTRYAMFQDDLVCVKNLREYLERTDYPEKGYLNLNTFPENEYKKLNPKGKDGFVGFYPANQRGRMALALIFSNEAVKTLLSAWHMVDRVQGNRRHICIDGGIVTAFKKAGWKEYVHDPSLTWHTGDQSAMRNRRQPAAQTFPGEHFDALGFLEAR